MVKRLPTVVAVCALLLGAAHMVFGFIIYPAFNLDALWFYGAGLAMMAVAASNLAAGETSKRASYLMTVQNLVMAGYFAVALTVLPAIQVVVGFLLFALLALFRIMTHRKEKITKAGIDSI